MMTTSLAGGVDLRTVEGALAHLVRLDQVVHRQVHAVEVAALARRVSRATVDPVAITIASKPSRRSSTVRSTPDLAVRRRTHALGGQLLEPAVEHVAVHLELGDAVPHQAADPAVPLEDGDLVPGPGQLLRGRQPGRPGADDRHLLAGGPSAGRGVRPPAAIARSAISCSTSLIATGSSPMPRTQAPSQGAGQSRPVNSGKLFVACNRSDASSHRSSRTSSFHSGIRFPSGHPWWQNGTPQSMHRAACSRVRSGANGSYTSPQSRSRNGTGRRLGVCRGSKRQETTRVSHGRPP